MKLVIAEHHTAMNVFFCLNRHVQQVVLGVYGELPLACVPGQVPVNVQLKIKRNVMQQKVVVDIINRVAGVKALNMKNVMTFLPQHVQQSLVVDGGLDLAMLLVAGRFLKQLVSLILIASTVLPWQSDIATVCKITALILTRLFVDKLLDVHFQVITTVAKVPILTQFVTETMITQDVEVVLVLPANGCWKRLARVILRLSVITFQTVRHVVWHLVASGIRIIMAVDGVQPPSPLVSCV